jgi:hypothetical protein
MNSKNSDSKKRSSSRDMSTAASNKRKVSNSSFSACVNHIKNNITVREQQKSRQASSTHMQP